MKKSKKAKAGNAVEATFPLTMDLKPHEDQLRAIYRKLETPISEGSLRFLARGDWSQNLTNAQLVDLIENIRSLYPVNSIINYGLWEVRNRLIRRPSATRVSAKQAQDAAMILALPDPS